MSTKSTPCWGLGPAFRLRSRLNLFAGNRAATIAAEMDPASIKREYAALRAASVSLNSRLVKVLNAEEISAAGAALGMRRGTHLDDAQVSVLMTLRRRTFRAGPNHHGCSHLHGDGRVAAR